MFRYDGRRDTESLLSFLVTGLNRHLIFCFFIYFFVFLSFREFPRAGGTRCCSCFSLNFCGHFFSPSSPLCNESVSNGFLWWHFPPPQKKKCRNVFLSLPNKRVEKGGRKTRMVDSHSRQVYDTSSSPCTTR